MNKEDLKSKKLKKDTVCSTFRGTWLGIMRMYNNQALAYNGTIAYGYYLLNVDSQEGAFQRDIAFNLNMNGTGLARITKELEEKGFIIRKSGNNDKRLVTVTLTEKGKEAKKTAKELVIKFNDDLKDKIGEKRINSFFETAKMVEHIANDKNNEFLNVKKSSKK